MEDHVSAREENRMRRRRRKNGQLGAKMIGGSVKGTILIAEQIMKRAKNEAAKIGQPQTPPAQPEQHSKSGCA